jgi:hypothetical protein
MSVYFIAKDSLDIWNPANIAARLFCDQAESAARVLGTETGLGQIIADEVAVDNEKFISFAASLSGLVIKTQPGSAARRLLEACCSLVLALAQKLGADLPDDPVVAQLAATGRRVIR